MGVITQDTNAQPLSSMYPSFYRESQIRNWTHVNIVITEMTGEQHCLPPVNTREREACIEIEARSITGLRSRQTQFATEEIPIPGKKVTIPFDLIRNAPYKHNNLIISTVDHAAWAKSMVNESMINPLVYETRVDMDIADPRLVFQVIDPSNQWSELYVNVFGQTIIVRAGHYAEDLPFPKPEGETNKTADEDGTLICYLRYPHEYYFGANPVTTVFEVSLESVTHGQPIKLPSGDVICVSPTLEGLQLLLQMKAAGNTGRSPSRCLSDKMVPKEVFESAKANLEAEAKRMQEAHKVELETLKTNHASTVSKLNAKIEALTREKESLETQNRRWEDLNKARAKVDISDAEVRAAEAKARKEAAEAAKHEIDNVWLALKIAGMVATSVASFCITMYAKKKR